MSLSLANMLTIVKRNVPTTTMDTELQDALLQRMNYLVSLDTFPFQEKYQSTTLAANEYRLAVPSNFAYPKSVVIWVADYERFLDHLDPGAFDEIYPMPSDITIGTPNAYCIKVAEGEIWFNCPADIAYTVRIVFHAIPTDAADTTVSQLTELAKICLTKWASADGFRMMGEHDRAAAFEQDGDKTLAVMKRRYELSREDGARIISPKEILLRRKGL